MKYRLLLAFLCSGIFCKAQYSELSAPSIKAGIGYAKDYPGVHGLALQVMYQLPIASFLEAGIGLQHAQMKGYPRTATIQEYTKATSLDFEMYFLPVHTESHIIRLGLGYSFSFYQIKKAHPVLEKPDSEINHWVLETKKGLSKGMTVTGEYEYQFSETLHAGLRASLLKAYNGALYVGPFVAVSL